MAILQHIAFTLVQTIACMVWQNVEVMNMCSRGLSEQQRQWNSQSACTGLDISLPTLDHMINSFAGTTTMHALLLQPPRTHSNAHSEGGEPQLAVMPMNVLFARVRTTKAKQVLRFGVSEGHQPHSMSNRVRAISSSSKSPTQKREACKRQVAWSNAIAWQSSLAWKGLGIGWIRGNKQKVAKCWRWKWFWFVLGACSRLWLRIKNT